MMIGQGCITKPSYIESPPKPQLTRKWNVKPTEGRMTGSSTATDWAAPDGTPIPQVVTGTIKRTSLLRTDHLDFSLKGER